MKYILDTNTVIALLKGHSALVARLRNCSPQDVVLSSIVSHELFFGAYRSRRRGENIATVEALRFEVLDFSVGDARRAGELRAELAAVECPIGPYDVLIAGQALCRGLTLVTHNTREFNRVSGLSVEDWER